MTGKEKIDAVFSDTGCNELPVFFCYEDLYIRDHWSEITKYPWWFLHSPLLIEQIQCRKECIDNLALDFYHLPQYYNKKDQENLHIEITNNIVYLIDRSDMSRKKLYPPKISGYTLKKNNYHNIMTTEDVDEYFSNNYKGSSLPVLSPGSDDLACELIKLYGQEKHAFCYIASPLWSCYNIWGFEQLMINIASTPEIVIYACNKFLKVCYNSMSQSKALGASFVWIEECYTDMISPELFKTMNLPYIRSVIEMSRELGLKSIYYYTGDPCNHLSYILDSGSDAYAFEESKKNFTIDLSEIAGIINGRAVLFGNIDSIKILQNGSENDLTASIHKQIQAARANKFRFVMSTGSPPTPSTPLSKINLYCELVRNQTGIRYK